MRGGEESGSLRREGGRGDGWRREGGGVGSDTFTVM